MKSLILWTLLFFPVCLFSQTALEGGLLLGASNYLGDIASETIEVSDTHVAGGIFLRYPAGKHFFFRPGVYLTHLSADDANSKRRAARGFSFEADLFEATMIVEWHFLGNSRRKAYRSRQRVMSPYLFSGVGFTLADAAVSLSEETPVEALREPFPEADDRAFFLAVPFGGGLRFNTGGPFALGVEVGSRAVFSDYLDGVSVNGGPEANDWYLIGGLTLSYVFGQGGGTGCPTF